MRLIAVSLWRKSVVQRWLCASRSCELLSRVWASNPELMAKPYKPLAEDGLDFGQRITILLNHYGLLQAVLPPIVCNRLYLGGGMSWKFGAGYVLRLADAGPNPREGELALYWICVETGHCLAQLSFYLTPGDGGVSIFVGGLQGPAGDEARGRIRVATRACEGLRPKDAVMAGLLAFAARVGARRIVAVARANHVSRQRYTPRTIHSDYEGFWAEAHGMRLPDGNFSVPVCQPTRNLEEIPSRKRAAWRRKQALVQAIRAAVSQGLCEPSGIPQSHGMETNNVGCTAREC